MTERPSRRQALAGAAAVGLAACQPRPAKETKMFSDQGIADLTAMLQAHVARGSAPGLVAWVEHGGQTHAIPAGALSLEPGAAPVKVDAIFRLASMTKLVTSAAALMLVDEGKLKLDEPIDRLTPELADRRVLKRLESPLVDTVAANRPITVEDVLTFRCGWGISFEDHPITRATADLYGFGMPNPAGTMTADAWLQRLSKLPLMAQPGERWLYTFGSDLLGVLIERASGQSLPAFFQQRILGPLGMADTAFHIPPEKRARSATAYMPENGKLTLWDKPDGMYARPPAFPAGDSGLVSTAGDYAAFLRFLDKGTAPDGTRLLSEASLKGMKTDRLTAAQRKDGEMILLPGRGWGLGMSVVAEPNADGLTPGTYGWMGGFGTSAWSDPSRDLKMILLTQRVFDGPDPPQLHKDFWKAAYAAIA